MSLGNTAGKSLDGSAPVAATEPLVEWLKALEQHWRRKADRIEGDGQDIARDSGRGVTHPDESAAIMLRDCADEIEALLQARRHSKP